MTNAALVVVVVAATGDVDGVVVLLVIFAAGGFAAAVARRPLQDNRYRSLAATIRTQGAGDGERGIGTISWSR